MYCQKCGKQIDDGSDFCKYCGSKINGETVSRNNFVVQRQSTEHTKSKAEFISDYRAKHSERMVYTVLFIIFEIVATIVFIMNVSSYIDHHRDDNLIGMIIAVFIEVIAIIFACAMKKYDSTAEQEYNKYIMINDSSNQRNSSWRCQKCGTYNDGTSLYCARCSCEKPYVITGNSNTVNKNVHRADVWICPNCGRENQNYVGSCGCGEVKPK